MARQDQPALCFSNLLNKEQIDMKIESLRLQIVQIKDEIRSLEEYKNNRCLPVSKLPPEVLSTIFESIAMTSEDGLEPYSDLLSATQVCRLWRQVALDSPRIWSVIYCSAPPRLVDLLLERSKTAPLHLLYSDDNVPENVEKVLTHLHRLKELNLVDCEDDWLSRIISQGAPQLESLSLSNYGEIDTFEPPVDAFPVLQHLELFGFVYTPSVASLTTLRSLVINASRSVPQPHSSIEFLAILASLPNLSKLSLTEALTPSDGPLPSSSVRLAHLTGLYIQDADIRNFGLMACITAPQLKTIDLHHSGKASAEIATPVVAAIFQKLPTLATSYSALTLGVGGSSFARVELWDDCVTSGTAKRAPFFGMLIYGAGDLRTEESVLTLFPPTTYPPTLYFPSSIQIASYHSRYAPLRRILRQLTRVTEVRTSGLRALTNLLDDAHPISLPSLKQIVLQTDYNCMDKQALLAKFVEQLKVRKGLHDVEIETFVVFDTNKQLTPADLKLFEGLVKVSKRKTKRRDQHVF